MKPSKTLICPHCGCERAIEPYWRGIMSIFFGKVHCVECGSILSNPRWFDTLRLIGAFLCDYIIVFVLYQNSVPRHGELLDIALAVAIYWHITAFIAIYLIPLKMDYKAISKTLKHPPRLTCPKCGCKTAITPATKKQLWIGWYSNIVRPCVECRTMLRLPIFKSLLMVFSAFALLLFAISPLTSYLSALLPENVFIKEHVVDHLLTIISVIVIFNSISHISLYYIDLVEE